MAHDRLKLDGQVALITGGGRGIGRGIATVFAEAGAAVVVTARTPDQLEETVTRIRNGGGRAISVVGDVVKRVDNERAVAAALDAFGRIDILVNNAGGGNFKPFLELADDDFRLEFEWNALSAFMLTQIATPHMLKNGGGCVLSISSAAGRFGIRGMTPYSVAKAALEQLTRSMAQELSPKIRVNAIALGTIVTEALRHIHKLDPGLRDRMLAMIPLHREGSVEDIGMAALYLCSPDCYATGSILHIDGGIQRGILAVDIPDL